MKQFFSNRCQPLIMGFRGSVGNRPREHWIHDPVDGGGVILGEACHYIDFCRWMVGSPIAHVEARCLGHHNSSIVPEDNVAIFLRFEDGSMAHILYISNGARGFSRERCEVHADACSAVWKDFRYVKLMKDLGLARVHRNWFFPKKGYKEELDIFFSAVMNPNLAKCEWLPGELDASLAAIRSVKGLFR